MSAEVKVPPTPDETFSQTLKGFGAMVERITPWLLDLRSWIFGALIAFDIVILAALLTVGPADLAALIATAALALALPPNAAGFFLLRLLEDIKKARLEEVAVEAFQEAGFGVTQVQSSDTSESMAKHGLVDQRRLRGDDTGESGRARGSDGQLAVSLQGAF